MHAPLLDVGTVEGWRARRDAGGRPLDGCMLSATSSYVANLLIRVCYGNSSLLICLLSGLPALPAGLPTCIHSRCAINRGQFSS